MNLRNGFTLIELLVVISIISILAAMSVVGIMAALGDSDKAQCKMMIEDLKAALESYQMNNGGEYPPTMFERINQDIASDNMTNSGIETCLLLLRSKGFPMESYQDRLGNLDADENQPAYEFFGFNVTRYELFELLDPWGNPFVYIPAPEYDDEFEYSTAEGETVIVRARKMAMMQEFPQGYMIWSFGPDGINQDGKGDDITSWAKSKEDMKDPAEEGLDDDDDDDDGDIIDD